MKILNKIIGAFLGLAMAIGTGFAVSNNSKVVPAHAAAGDTVSFLFTTSSAKKLNTAYGANTLADDNISGLNVSCTTAKVSGAGDSINGTYNTSFGGEQMTTNANRNQTVSFTFENPWAGTHAIYKEYTQINSVTFTGVAGSGTTYNVTCTIDGVAATGDNSGFSATKTTTTFTPATGHNKGIIIITVAYSSGSKGWYFDNLGINAEIPAASCTHNWVAGTVHAPTCTEAGYTEYECSLCHETKNDDVVAALGHDFEDGVCTVCGALESASIIILPADGTAATSSDWSITKSGITISAIASTLNSDQMRIFKGKTITISSNDENIIRIKFECTASGATQYGPGCFAETSGYFYEGTIGQYLGATKSITFTAETNQVRITKITIWLASKANWCAAFSDLINCDETGATQPWSNKWPLFKTAFNGLEDADKTDFKTLNNTVTVRYDYIVGKYDYEDFMNRSPARIGNSKILAATITNTNEALPVIIISFIAITAIGAYAVFRKKKEN